jgi:hypothetical protein
MNDILTRAWNALTPEQRPEGVVMATGNDGTSMFGDYQEERGHIKMSDAAAYDRLCVACERVVLEAGCTQEKIGGDYVWGKFPDVYGGHHCQLTAAVLAIEAIKGGDK